MNHHVIDTTGGGAREDEVKDSEDENTQKEEERPRDHYVLSVGLVGAHPLEVGPEAPLLIVSTREATCVRCPIRQQQLNATASGRFHDDTSSRY